MCLGTFSRLRRSLATSTLCAAVRILAEHFLLYRKAISCKVKKSQGFLLTTIYMTCLIKYALKFVSLLQNLPPAVSYECLATHKLGNRTENVPWHILAPAAVACDIYLLYAAVCILAERFLLYRKAISCKVKK